MTDVTMETGVYGEGDMYYFMDMDMAILAESPDSEFNTDITAVTKHFL